MENIHAVVERNGSSMDRVVKCLVMLADMSEWSAMNQVYVTFFPPSSAGAKCHGRQWARPWGASRDRVFDCDRCKVISPISSVNITCTWRYTSHMI